MRTIGSRFTGWLAGVGVLASTAVTAVAQCPLPDNLDGGACWGATAATLPEFPALEAGVRGLCWLECTLEADRSLTLEIDAPRQARHARQAPVPLCSYYIARYTVTDGAGTALWSGVIRMAYARTWYETGPGSDYQVWRFLTNGDLRPTAAAGATPCPVPPCAAAFNNKVHFTGYVDYAMDCVTGAFTSAGALGHEVDSVDHFAGFPRSGTFHATRSYDFVWPAAGFTPETLAFWPPSPYAMSGTLRPLDWSVLPASSQIEIYESPITDANIVKLPGEQFCLGGSSAGFSTYPIYLDATSGACGYRVAGAGGARTILCRSIGSWTDPDVFPGAELLFLARGNLNLTDPCRPRSRSEYFSGVMTQRGFAPRSITRTGIGGSIFSNMIDLGNEVGLPPAMAVSRNFKYITDFIVNVNFQF